jgi:NADH-quinone oxidoreductase subunit N
MFGALRTGGAYSAIAGVALFSAACALAAMKRSAGEGVSTALVGLCVGGAIVAASGVDLVTILIGLETAAVSGYALVAIARTSRSAEAAMKYFVQGAVATGLFVLGLAALAGTFSADGVVASIAEAMGEGAHLPMTVLLGTVAVMTAVAFKAGAAPFHSWAPDAYESADPAPAAVLAGAVKLAMLATLVLFVTVIAGPAIAARPEFGGYGAVVFVVCGVLGVLSVVVGSTIALTTGSYRRMLGYAGVAQVGYALIALGSLNPSAALFFMATYALGTTAAFLGAEAFTRTHPEWDGSVAGLAGLGRRAPVTAGAVSVALLSLAGIPPLIGFWGKLQAFAAAIAASAQFWARGESTAAVWFGVLAVTGVVGSVVSLGYYGGVIRTLFFGEPESAPADGPPTGADAANVVVIALAVVLVVGGLAPVFIGITDTVRGFLLG